MAEIDERDVPPIFEELVERALAGEEIVITRSGEPLATFVPARPTMSTGAGGSF